MKVKFWGVRGSIASPGPSTVRYGGNTTCIEVRTDAGSLIVLDAGTGIFRLSHTLFPEFPLRAHIFNTHTHWDHIQGLPFFIPLFVPGNHVHIYGARDPVNQRDISEILTAQLQYRFFPIREVELKSEIQYESLQEGQQVVIDDAVVTPILMNHPVINFGYRIDCNGKSVFFSGDHEPLANIYAPDDDGHDDFQSLIDEKNSHLLDAIRGVDLLIADASYTIEEFPAKVGWGHGTFDSCMQLARDAAARMLFCTHHEPTRGDEALEKVFAEALARQPDSGPEYRLAQEGLEIEI